MFLFHIGLLSNHCTGFRKQRETSELNVILKKKNEIMDLLILLDNPKKDLEKIQNALRNFECSLTVEEERIIINTSTLVGEVDLEDNTSISQVWEDVKDFIDIINGSAIVEGFSMSSINLHYVKYIDKNGEAHFLPNIGNMYAVLPGLRGSQPYISEFIPLALSDKTVAKALRLCSRELDWVNLYRIYEVISEDVGGMTGKDIKIFKGSANNSKVTGDFSRHGKSNVGTPEETMRLADAQHLIKSKVREWVNKKITEKTENIKDNKLLNSNCGNSPRLPLR